MIECESVSKAAHQLASTSTMERGYSLEAVIDAGTSNHDQEKQSNLFTLPGMFFYDRPAVILLFRNSFKTII